MQSVSYYRVQALCSLMQALFVICLLSVLYLKPFPLLLVILRILADKELMKCVLLFCCACLALYFLLVFLSSKKSEETAQAYDDLTQDVVKLMFGQGRE